MADAAVETGTDNFVSEFDESGQGLGATGTEGTPSPAAVEGVGAPASDVTEAAPTETAPATQQVDLVAALEKMLQEEAGGPKPTPKLSPEAELQKLLQGVQPGSPADQRIRTLANARSAATAQVAEATRQLDEVKQYIPQVQRWAEETVRQVSTQKDQQIQALTTQLQSLSASFEALKGVMPKPPVDPAEELQNRWQTGVQDIIAKERETWEKERLTPLQQKIEAIEKYKADQDLKVVVQDVRSASRRAAESIVMRGLEVADPQARENLVMGLSAEVIAYQMHTGKTYEESAMAVRQKHMLTASLFARAAAKGFATAQKTGREAPTATTTRRNAGLGAPVPSLAEIHKMGYTDELDFMQAQDKAQGL